MAKTSKLVADQWGYARVKGVRVNVEKYERKMRKLQRLVGTRCCAKLRFSKVVHSATRVLVPPRGRQVYPRIGVRLDCGTETSGMAETYGIVTCKRCRA